MSIAKPAEDDNGCRRCVWGTGPIYTFLSLTPGAPPSFIYVLGPLFGRIKKTEHGAITPLIAPRFLFLSVIGFHNVRLSGGRRSFDVMEGEIRLYVGLISPVPGPAPDFPIIFRMYFVPHR